MAAVKSFIFVATFVAFLTYSVQAKCPFSEQPKNGDKQQPRGHHKPFGHHARSWRRIETVYEHPEPQEFYNNYVRLSKPLVIKGGAANWPAIKKWTNISYINEIGGSERNDINYKQMYDYDKYHAIRVDMTMKEFTDQMDNHNLYMDSTILKGLHDDVYWPHSLGCKFFLKRVKQLAIMMNNGKSKSDVHIDATDTYFMQATGRRLWLLVHPSNVTKIYSGHPHLVDHTGISIINKTGVDLEKHFDTSNLVIYAGYLYPGDIIFTPEGWFHQVVTNGSPNIAISAFLNVLLCQYNSDGASGDIAHVTSCINKVLEKKPKKLECDAFPKKDITITELLKTYKPRTAGAFDVASGLTHGRSYRMRHYAKKLHDGKSLPTIVMSLNGMTKKALDEKKVLMQGIKEGHRFFATAPGDGSEEALGRILYKHRPKIQVLSYLPIEKAESEGVETSIKASLVALNTPYIDFVLLTVPYCVPDYTVGACTRDAFQPSWAKAWVTLEKLQQEGKIRYLGVSDFSLKELKHLQKTAKLPISIARARFDVYFRNLEFRHYCRDNKIHFMGRSILGRRWKEEQPNCPDNRDIVKEYSLLRAAYQFKLSIHAATYDFAVKKNVIIAPRVNDPLHVRVNIRSIDSESNEQLDNYYDVDALVPSDRDGLYSPTALASDFSRLRRPAEAREDEEETADDAEDENEEDRGEGEGKKQRKVENSDTLQADDYQSRQIEEVERARQLTSGNHSEETYTDDKDFEVFPAYMLDGESED